MKKFSLVSIIVPLYVIEKRFFIDLHRFASLDYPNFEILIVTDKKVVFPKIKKLNIRLIITGHTKTGPAEKRDIAIAKARGEICAFIDDDAYPRPDWLSRAMLIMNKYKVSAVCGPGVTPPEDDYWRQMTGIVYSSFFCGGHAQYRFVQQSARYVYDYPAYNLLVRTKALKSVGGYGNHFYGGEDTFLCLKLIRLGHQIRYDPSIVVFHHRRPLYISYLKQIANIGLHRGYFARVFKKTSAYPGYFLPSVLFLGLSALIITSFFIEMSRITLAILFPTMLLLAMISVIKKTSILNSFIVAWGIIFTHVAYGASFIRGYLTSKLIH